MDQDDEEEDVVEVEDNVVLLGFVEESEDGDVVVTLDVMVGIIGHCLRKEKSSSSRPFFWSSESSPFMEFCVDVLLL